MQMTTETNVAAATSLDSADRRTNDLMSIKDELRFCIDNGMYGPRTGAALRWALEVLEDIEAEVGT